MTEMLQPQPIGIPVPHASTASLPYWEAAARGELVYQRCTACGATPARALLRCGHCGERALVWAPSAGRGTLYSWTVVRRPVMPAFVVPYAPAIVELAEGPFMMSSMIGCAVDDLAAGMALEVEFHPVSDDRKLPYFRPR